MNENIVSELEKKTRMKTTNHAEKIVFSTTPKATNCEVLPRLNSCPSVPPFPWWFIKQKKNSPGKARKGFTRQCEKTWGFTQQRWGRRGGANSIGGGGTKKERIWGSIFSTTLKVPLLFFYQHHWNASFSFTFTGPNCGVDLILWVFQLFFSNKHFWMLKFLKRLG